jgi:hypothetical protein
LTDETDARQLTREAKAIVALAFRNGPLRRCALRDPCPACAGKSGVSQISNDEMKLIMKNAVNKSTPCSPQEAPTPDRYAREIAYGERHAAEWDDPK